MEYTIDCALIADARQFHRTLAQVLSLPDWYGHNLDGLFDCLTELEAPVHLVLKNWWEGEAFFQGFRSAFQEAQADNPDFSVQFD